MVYTYSGVLFSHKKELSSDTCYNMDMHAENMPSEIRQTQKDKYHMIPLIGIT